MITLIVGNDIIVNRWYAWTMFHQKNFDAVYNLDLLDLRFYPLIVKQSIRNIFDKISANKVMRTKDMAFIGNYILSPEFCEELLQTSDDYRVCVVHYKIKNPLLREKDEEYVQTRYDFLKKQFLIVGFYSVLSMIPRLCRDLDLSGIGTYVFTLLL